MRNLTCIVCPIGCSLDIEDDGNDLSITGNKCPRGLAYAQEEIRSPKRVVTATCQLEAGSENSVMDTVRRVPVKTATPCPKEKISALLEDIYKTKVTLPVKTGDIVIANWNGEGVDVVATRSLD